MHSSSTSIMATAAGALLVLCAVGTGGVAWAVDGGAGSCNKPRVLIVLDKSSSMVTGKVGGKTKWSLATAAITSVVTKFETSIDFGLMIFPNPSQCGWGAVKVGVGPARAKAIIAELATAPPTSGNWTPMAQSLDVAGTVKNLQVAGYSNNVLLITDGWQWCDPYDSKTRTLPVTSVAKLTQQGITSFVVGFGDGVDTKTLNQMAEVAKTKVSATCNPKNTSPSARDNCYYQANNSSQLVAALQAVALKLTKEKCDNVDNDCNGKVDDGLSQPCTTKCGSGTETCTGGVWGNCSAAKPETEKCDGKDNNCDGTIDEGCSCVDGSTRACGKDTGECVKGTQTCTGGTWGTCTGGTGPATETCDAKDNDCDGKTDEDRTRPCTTKCGSGTETCSLGTWIGCTAPDPTKEICDGKDNDCDGTIDGPNTPCANGVCVGGICQVIKADAGGSSVIPPGPSETGCNCETGAGGTGMAWMMLLLLGLVAWRRVRQ